MKERNDQVDVKVAIIGAPGVGKSGTLKFLR